MVIEIDYFTPTVLIAIENRQDLKYFLSAKGVWCMFTTLHRTINSEYFQCYIWANDYDDT